jgi:phenylacetyl-CoA:acceptor oxidoreductase subunit 2
MRTNPPFAALTTPLSGGRQQKHWDARAALNFMLGGTGSGLIVALAVAGAESPIPVILALALIAAGLGAVWLEIGRKLRALHVLFNPFTSWMTREAFVAVLLFPLGLGAVFVPSALPAAAVAAAVFLYCQARILRAAKGIPAWRAPQVVPLIAATGLAEGAGLALFFSQATVLIALFAIAVGFRAFAGWRYRAAVTAAVPALSGVTVAILVLVAAGLYVQEALLLAGVAAVASGWWLKFALVTRAAPAQGFTLPRVPVRGAR